MIQIDVETIHKMVKILNNDLFNQYFRDLGMTQNEFHRWVKETASQNLE